MASYITTTGWWSIMRTGDRHRDSMGNNDAGAATMIEYILISGILDR